MSMIHVMADAATGRVGAVSDGFCLGAGELVLEAPEGFELDRHMDWRVQDGALVHDPLPEPEPIGDPAEDALVELAALAADNATRLDEQDAALVELAALITGGE